MTIDEGHDGETGVICHHRDGILHVAGEIDSATCAIFRRALAELVDQHVRIDFALVRFCDSSCLAVVLDLVRSGREVTILRPQHTVRRVLEVVGALELDGLHIED